MYIPSHFAADPADVHRPVGDVAGIVAGLTARGEDRNAAAVENANAQRVSERGQA